MHCRRDKTDRRRNKRVKERKKNRLLPAFACLPVEIESAGPCLFSLSLSLTASSSLTHSLNPPATAAAQSSELAMNN